MTRLTELIDQNCPAHYLKNALLTKREIIGGFDNAWEYRFVLDNITLYLHSRILQCVQLLQSEFNLL